MSDFALGAVVGGFVAYLLMFLRQPSETVVYRLKLSKFCLDSVEKIAAVTAERTRKFESGTLTSEELADGFEALGAAKAYRAVQIFVAEHR